jgi:hypothetical protein
MRSWAFGRPTKCGLCSRATDMMHLSLRLLSFILFLLAAGSVAVGWQDTLDRTPSPVPETDTVSDAVRTARDRPFANVLRNFPSQLSQSPGTPFPMTIGEKLPMPELPVAQAQTIAIDQIIGLTPRVIRCMAIYSTWWYSADSRRCRTAGSWAPVDGRRQADRDRKHIPDVPALRAFSGLFFRGQIVGDP